MGMLDKLMSETVDAAPTGGLLDRLEQGADVESTKWQPHKEPSQPKGIEGRIVDAYEIDGEYADPATGEIPRIPCLIIAGVDGTTWGVRGYHKILREEIKKKSPTVGDTIAILYVGEKRSQVRGRKPAHVYRVAVAKAQPTDGGPGF